MTAGELGAKFHLSPSTMSGHFAVLKEAELIQLEEAVMTLLDTFKIEPGARK